MLFPSSGKKASRKKTFPDDGGKLHGVTTQKTLILVVTAKDLEPGVIFFQFTRCMSVPFVSVLLLNLLSSRLLSRNLKIKIYRTIILPLVLYGCETWSLTLREKRKLRVFENMVLRRVHNEELNDLYSSPNIVRVIKSRRMRWAGHVARMGEERGVYRGLVWKPEGRRPLGRSRRRWVDNIRMDLQEVGCGYMDWIGLAQNRNRWRTLVVR